MRVGVYRDQIDHSKTLGIRGEIFFSPLAEMMMSMHVICNPDHHTHSHKWMSRVASQLDSKLLEEIRQVGTYTSEWLVPIDIAFGDDMVELELMDSLYELNRMTYMHIQKFFERAGLKVSNQQVEFMRRVLMEYAVVFFKDELIFYRAAILHELRKVQKKWQSEGIAPSLTRIHDRFVVSEQGIVYRKQKDFLIPYNEIEKIQYTASFFAAPHLIMGTEPGIVLALQPLRLEKGTLEPPSELVNKYHVLGDSTRLKILKLLRNKPDTTQNLAKKLNISEAAVSKQLKLLSEVGFVSKKRTSFYQYYYINKEALEFMTYLLFEYL